MVVMEGFAEYVCDTNGNQGILLFTDVCCGVVGITHVKSYYKQV